MGVLNQDGEIMHPGKDDQVLCMKSDNHWVQADCHFLSQLSHERIEAYMSVYSNNASAWESSRSPRKICSALPVSQLLILGRRMKITWGSGQREAEWVLGLQVTGKAGREG